jgi:hypothetical protein
MAEGGRSVKASRLRMRKARARGQREDSGMACQRTERAASAEAALWVPSASVPMARAS